MSFFDTLQQMGLFKGGQQPAQPQQNPYGLDQQAMRQVGLQTLGNLGQQIMALSQQMTPAQRAAMMSRADFTGGMQQNLYNAAQMKLLQDKRAREAQDEQRTKAAQMWLTQKIGSLPDGVQKRNAMIYLQLGDIQKAAEAITQVPQAPEYQIVDGYRVERDNPNAPAIPIAGLPGEKPKEVDPKDRLPFLKAYEDAPEVQSYNILASTIGSLSNAVYDDSKVSDLDFVYGVAKALDPTSVVRESEAGMVIDAQGLDAATLGRLNSIWGGGALRPEQRLELLSLVRRRAEALRPQVETRRRNILDVGAGVIDERLIRPIAPLAPVPMPPQIPQTVAPGRGGRLDALPEPELLRVE